MRPLPNLYGVLCVSLCTLLLCAKTAALSNPQPDPQAEFSYSDTDRANYKKALQLLGQGRLTQYYELKQSLHQYPLKPYLDYQEVKQKLRQLPYNRVDAFLQDNENQYLAIQLRKHWLNTLARKRLWNQYLNYWKPEVANNRLECYYLQALYESGDKTSALQQTTQLWLAGHSQPSACDPLFKLWLNSSYRSTELIWQRLDNALQKGNSSLARYAGKQLPASKVGIAEQYIHWHRYPADFSTKKAAQLPEQYRQTIIAHTLKRLGYRNPEMAEGFYDHYQRSGISIPRNNKPANPPQQAFNEEQQQAILRAITLGYQNQSPQQALTWLIKVDPNGNNSELLQWRIRLALSLYKWQEVYNWISLLPEQERQATRWSYWRARAQEKIGFLPLQADQQSPAIFADLAKKRDYYGFLAADHQGVSYHMQDEPIDVDNAVYREVSHYGGFQRAIELFHIGDINAARREWWHSANQIPQAHLPAVAKLAEVHQMHPTAIHSMIKAGEWNDLSIRFPLAYEQPIRETARQEKIDTNWLYAIARQESAFTHDAKSSAGALGILQLMPRTARQAAQSLGIRYQQEKLLQPETNIKIGGSYLASLYRQFDGNRVLATAAYNAGPHRVRQWLRNTQQPIEPDIWVESIPFRETRHYVQNVLAFSVIYGYRRNERPQLVQVNESSIVYN